VSPPNSDAQLLAFTLLVTPVSEHAAASDMRDLGSERNKPCPDGSVTPSHPNNSYLIFCIISQFDNKGRASQMGDPIGTITLGHMERRVGCKQIISEE
jgi:hypothetical protein